MCVRVGACVCVYAYVCVYACERTYACVYVYRRMCVCVHTGVQGRKGNRSKRYDPNA